jgi:membrane fusion protein (multidrug efflux system)
MFSKIKIFITVGILFGLGLIATIIHYTQTSDIAQTPSVLVQLFPVKQLPMAKTLISYGTVNVAPEHVQQITIQNEALVQQIFVTQGQRVKDGDPLIQLSTTAGSSLNLKTAKIAVDFAHKELDRFQKARSQFLATNADVQTAKQNLEKAQATLNNLHEQQQKETGNIIRSNCNCNIVAVNVQPGQVVAPATTLLTYANISQVQIRLGIESEDLAMIQVKQKVIITPIYNTVISYTGYINNITDQIDPKTGLIDVIVPLGNISGIIPGSMVRGLIYLEPEKNKLVVPRSAVLFKNHKAFVFVDVNGKAEERAVSTGEDDGKFVAILNGLKVNEPVVIVGNYELQNGMDIRVEPQL